MPADAEPVSMAEVTAFLACTLRLTRTGPHIAPAEQLAQLRAARSMPPAGGV